MSNNVSLLVLLVIRFPGSLDCGLTPPRALPYKKVQNTNYKKDLDRKDIS